jgi:nicotinamidase/pyrazinamidase
MNSSDEKSLTQSMLTIMEPKSSAAKGSIKIGQTDALIVVDIQNDFLPGGALAVPNGGEIICRVNWLMEHFSTVVITQDWHPLNHSSFAVNNPGRKEYEDIEMPYGTQKLWPVHCVMKSVGAELPPGLKDYLGHLTIKKGFRASVDSYSAFFENDHETCTGLHGYLSDRHIRRVFFVGLAFDYCVGASAVDASHLMFDSFVIEDCCRGIDIDGSMDKMRNEFRLWNVGVINSSNLEF